MAAVAPGAAATTLKRRWLGVRVAVAGAGVVLTLAALLATLSVGTGGPLDPIGGLSRDVNTGLDQIDASLAQARASLASAQDTLDAARSSVVDASSTSASMSSSMNALADASGVQVLGVQPFAGLAPRFRELATNSAAMASSLDTTQGSIGASRTELGRLSDDLRKLSGTLSRLGADAEHGSQAGGGSALVLRLLIGGVLLWLAATAALQLTDAWRAWKGLTPLP